MEEKECMEKQFIRSVIANHDTESGITIHYVNKQYDEGDIIFQARCKVDPDDTPESLAAKVHALEYHALSESYRRTCTEIADFLVKGPEEA